MIRSDPGEWTILSVLSVLIYFTSRSHVVLQEDQFEFQDPELGADKEALIVQATMEPLVLETMTKFGDKQEVIGSGGGGGGG